jgi:hypothetical protein
MFSPASDLELHQFAVAQVDIGYGVAPLEIIEDIFCLIMKSGAKILR